MRDRSPPKPPPEVHYPTRDEQRAEAKAREERAAWRLATRPLQEFFANAKKGEGISPSTIRELLNELSEPPFAEGRLAPNARKAFELVAASAKETGSKRTFEEVEELVRGVVNPLYHLLTYGVKAPGAEGGGPPSSVAETIAEQMHTAAVKLLAASLDILSKGDATKKAVESAKGIVIVREQVAAKLAGRAPGGGRGDKETTVTRRDSVDGRGHGKGSAANKPARASGTDADRWDRKKTLARRPARKCTARPEAARKLGVMAGSATERLRVAGRRRQASPIPKVVIHRPFSEGKQRELSRRRRSGTGGPGGKPAVAQPVAAAGAEAPPFGPASAASQALGKSPPSARGGVFARLEGKPKPQGLGKSDLPAPKPDAAKELPHPKSTEKELPHPKRVVVVHKPNDPNDHKELPHPKPAPKPREPPAPRQGRPRRQGKTAKQRTPSTTPSTRSSRSQGKNKCKRRVDRNAKEFERAAQGAQGTPRSFERAAQGAPHPKPAPPAPGSEKPHRSRRPGRCPRRLRVRQALPHPNKPPAPKGNKPPLPKERDELDDAWTPSSRRRWAEEAEGAATSRRARVQGWREEDGRDGLTED